MNPTRLRRALEFMRTEWAGHMHPSAQRVLSDCVTQLEASLSGGSLLWKGNHEPGWGFVIDQDDPLRFLAAGGESLVYDELDLYGVFHWAPTDPPCLHIANVVVRVWRRTADGAGDPDYSALLPQEADTYTLPDVPWPDRRVVLRWHFDFAPHDLEPTYHVTFGGIPREHELHLWERYILTAPRIPVLPFDPILTIEFVGQNFFTDWYPASARDAAWKGTIRDCEKSLLAPYFEESLRHIRDAPAEESLYEHWMRPR